jgi:5-methylcytosine-specific restriction endonuclease McrA
MSILTLLRKLPFAPRVTNEYKYIYSQSDPSKCTYCGQLARAYDHVLPISIARLLPYFNFSPELLTLVPCCTRCNSIAGNRFFVSLASKKKYILERILELKVRARYAKVLDELEMYLRK